MYLNVFWGFRYHEVPLKLSLWTKRNSKPSGSLAKGTLRVVFARSLEQSTGTMAAMEPTSTEYSAVQLTERRNWAALLASKEEGELSLT